MACARPARVSIRTSESSDVGAPATSEAVSTLWMSGRGRKWYRALVSTVHQCDISYLPTRRDAFRACNILTIRELVEDAGFEIEIVAGARGGSAGPAAPRRDRAHVVQGHRALRVRRARLGRDAAVAPHGVDPAAAPRADAWPGSGRRGAAAACRPPRRPCAPLRPGWTAGRRVRTRARRRGGPARRFAPLEGLRHLGRRTCAGGLLHGGALGRVL